MYRFKPTDDFSYLENCNFTQFVIDRYQVSFVFSEGYRIVSELAFRHTRKKSGERVSYDVQVGLGAVHVQELLEQKVVAVTHSDWELKMVFENDDEIHVVTDEGAYECGNITGPGMTFYVF
jgi:hypothetical protein